MSKNCSKHQCFKKSKCQQKVWLGCLAMCRINNTNCLYCANLPYGRYEPEDILNL